MKIMIVGAAGVIGDAVAGILADDHEIIRVGHKDGDHQVDLGSKMSISALYDEVGAVDAVISIASLNDVKAFFDLDDAAFNKALSNQLMGQVNLVRIGAKKINEGGSFTLTSGAFSHRPIPGSTAISMVNGAIESFVKAAELELSPRVRINVVAPTIVKELMEKMGMCPTPVLSIAQTAVTYIHAMAPAIARENLDKLIMTPIPVLSAADTAAAYKFAVERNITGRILHAPDHVKTPWTNDQVFF